MEYIVSFLTGTLIKLYDDLTDLNIVTKYEEFIKTSIIVFFTIFLLNDVSLSILFLLGIMPATWLAGGLDNLFWKQVSIIPIITTSVSLHKIEYGGLFDLLQRLIFIGAAFVGTFLEAHIFEEEVSPRKAIGRVLLIVFLVCLTIMTNNLSAKRFIHSLLFASIGYFVVSIIFQFYLLSNEKYDENHSSNKQE